MTITVNATNAAAAAVTNAAALTLPSVEGRFQVVYLVGRTSSVTPSIDGTGWSTPVLIETQITNSDARRQVALWWRVVPAGASTTISANWSGSTPKVAFGYELSTNTVGGTWSKDNHAATDNATTAGTSLASGSAAPANAEAITIYGLGARHGGIGTDISRQDTYTNSFTLGPREGTGGGTADASGFSAYKIASGTQTTTASWTTSALVTGLIAAFSVTAVAADVPNLYVTRSNLRLA